MNRATLVFFAVATICLLGMTWSLSRIAHDTAVIASSPTGAAR